MNLQEFHIELVQILNDWDPFEIGAGNYETEIADIVQAVHDLENERELAVKIQKIYEFSFEEIIPLVKCLAIAKKLIFVKGNSSCSL